MKKNRNEKTGKGDISGLKWENIPFWLRWGTFGGIFSILLVILISIGMSFKYLLITRTLLLEGVVATFITFLAGLLSAAIFSLAMHKIGMYRREKLKQGIAPF